MFKFGKETKTNEVSDREISLRCVCQRKQYNIVTVKIAIVRSFEKKSLNPQSFFLDGVIEQLSTALLAALSTYSTTVRLAKYSAY